MTNYKSINDLKQTFFPGFKFLVPEGSTISFLLNNLVDDIITNR